MIEAWASGFAFGLALEVIVAYLAWEWFGFSEPPHDPGPKREG